jgi:hypothetical protein
MTSRLPRPVVLVLSLLLIAGAFVLSFSGAAQDAARNGAPAFGPGARVLLDAHNAYPYEGRWADRLDRALATGTPLAIEQDLVWRPPSLGLQGRSIVSHGEPFTGEEPGLRDHFFERVRPLVERALREGDRASWPLVTLNLDFKTDEPEHHAAVWQLLGEYESWLTTAERTADGSDPSPLRVGPLLVLTGDADPQQRAFHDAVAVGARLRLFGAVNLQRDAWLDRQGLAKAPRERQWEAWLGALPTLPLPRASNYRRWWNNPWPVLEGESQPRATDWTPAEQARLQTLVNRAHDAGLWIRFYTLNGHDDLGDLGWSKGYNFGSLDAVRSRWRAAIAAGVDFVATDQYEAFAGELRGR